MGQGPLKWTLNDPPNCPWLIWVHFRGPWPIYGPLEGSKAKSEAHSGQYFDLFWSSLTPPANPVNFFWFKMACTCVPLIVLHVSRWTRTSGGYFRSSEVKFRGILVLKGNLFYICKNTKNVFFSNLAQQNVLIFEIWTLFYVRAKSRKRLSLESNCSFKGGVLSCSFQYFLSKFRKSLLQLVCILFK